MAWWFGAGRSSESACKWEVSARAMLSLAFLLLTMDVRWVMAAIFAGVVHEMGHCIALWLCDEPLLHIRIDIPGAVIRTGPMDDGQELLCALTGPVFGLLLLFFYRWIPRTAVIALGQSLFNLIPIYPLDGGRGLLALRNICCKEREKGVQ